LERATGRVSGAFSPRTRRSGPESAGARMWGLLLNPTALIPMAQPGDIRQDRVGQLVKGVLDGMTSEEPRGAYRHALKKFLEFCGREGNPTLSAELVAGYRVSLIGEGKSSSTVGVHLAAVKSSDSGSGHGRIDAGRKPEGRRLLSTAFPHGPGRKSDLRILEVSLKKLEGRMTRGRSNDAIARPISSPSP
jgi:hypothetical protein